MRHRQICIKINPVWILNSNTMILNWTLFFPKFFEQTLMFLYNGFWFYPILSGQSTTKRVFLNFPYIFNFFFKVCTLNFFYCPHFISIFSEVVHLPNQPWIVTGLRLKIYSISSFFHVVWHLSHCQNVKVHTLNSYCLSVLEVPPS